MEPKFDIKAVIEYKKEYDEFLGRVNYNGSPTFNVFKSPEDFNTFKIFTHFKHFEDKSQSMFDDRLKKFNDQILKVDGEVLKVIDLQKEMELYIEKKITQVNKNISTDHNQMKQTVHSELFSTKDGRARMWNELEEMKVFISSNVEIQNEQINKITEKLQDLEEFVYKAKPSYEKNLEKLNMLKN